jgi:hypothetical protein
VPIKKADGVATRRRERVIYPIRSHQQRKTGLNDYHNGIVLPRTNWVYACAAVPASGTVRVFVNGQDRSGAQDFSTAGAPGQLGVNLGGFHETWRAVAA